MVDTAAPFEELEWSQANVEYPLNLLGNAYTAVRYDIERVQRGVMAWPGEHYALSDILARGGICPDQGYFATNVGKARGVPTLLFRGRGNDARHVWFGFLDGANTWQLEVGRYAEQRYVTGFAIDPQTWREVSDHELKFLAERFLQQPAYRTSRIHTVFATDFLARGHPVAAGSAALKAVRLEPKNFPAWEIVVAAEKELGFGAKERERTFREAAAALAAYPDLESGYITRVIDSLRSRGETAAADAERDRLMQKNRESRVDLNLVQMRRTLVQSFTSKTLEERVNIFGVLVAEQAKRLNLPPRPGRGTE